MGKQFHHSRDFSLLDRFDGRLRVAHGQSDARTHASPQRTTRGMLRTVARNASRVVRGPHHTPKRGMADGPPGGYFADGVQGEGHVNGRLFNETPPPPGQSRKWKDWELPWYLGMGGAAVILFFGLNAKPETSATAWAKEEAQKRLAAEGK